MYTFRVFNPQGVQVFFGNLWDRAIPRAGEEVLFFGDLYTVSKVRHVINNDEHSVHIYLGAP